MDMSFGLFGREATHPDLVNVPTLRDLEGLYSLESELGAGISGKKHRPIRCRE